MFPGFITSPGKLAKVLARSGMFLLNHVPPDRVEDGLDGGSDALVGPLW